MSLLTNFSVKNEGTLPSNLMTTEENLENTSEDEKIIVYNIERDFLIPMTVVSESGKESVKLRFALEEHRKEYGESIQIKKDDIYLEKIDDFSLRTNLVEIKYINELTLLFNLFTAMKKNISLLTINDISLFLNSQNPVENYYAIISLFSSHKKKYLLFQNYSDNKNIDEKLLDFYYVLYSSFFTYSVGYADYKEWFRVHKKIIFLIITNVKSLRFFLIMGGALTFVPFFPTDMKSFFSSESIFFEAKSKNVYSYNEDLEIKDVLFKISPESIGAYYSSKKSKIFVDSLYELFGKTEHFFIKIFVLFEISYSLFQKKKFFLSNIVFCLLLQLISSCVTLTSHKSSLIFLCNSKDEEDDALINEAIRQQICEESEKSNSLANFMQFYFELNFKHYMKNQFPSDKELLTVLELKYNIDFLDVSSHQNETSSALLNAFCRNYRNIIQETNDLNLNHRNISQIWLLDIISPLEKFNESFINDQNLIPLFFWVSHMVPYASFFNMRNLAQTTKVEVDPYRSVSRSIEKFQGMIRGIQTRRLIQTLKNKVGVIQKGYRRYRHKKIKELKFFEINESVLLKYKQDNLIIRYLINVEREIRNLMSENRNYKGQGYQKRNQTKENECYSDCGTSNTNTLESEINSLKVDLDQTVRNYEKLLTTGEEHSMKMKKMMLKMKESEEIKHILKKNGIELI